MAYIVREALLEELAVIFEKTDPEGAEQFGVLQCLRALRKAPVVDFVPVKHGRWVRHELAPMYRCSECKYGAFNTDWDFCPGCGAKMDLED